MDEFMKEMIIGVTLTIICVITMIATPFYHEYTVKKKAGKLDPKKSFFENYFFSPVHD